MLNVIKVSEVSEVIVPAAFSDFVDVSLLASSVELPKYTGINDHAIYLVDQRQPPYGPTYTLGPVDLKT